MGLSVSVLLEKSFSSSNTKRCKSLPITQGGTGGTGRTPVCHGAAPLPKALALSQPYPGQPPADGPGSALARRCLRTRLQQILRFQITSVSLV